MSIKDRISKWYKTQKDKANKAKDKLTIMAASHLFAWSDGRLLLRSFTVKQAFNYALKSMKREEIHSGNCIIMDDRLRIHLELTNGASLRADIVPTILSVQEETLLFKAELPKPFDIGHRNMLLSIFIRVFAKLLGIDKKMIDNIEGLEMDGSNFSYRYSVTDSLLITDLREAGLTTCEIPMSISSEGLELDLHEITETIKQLNYNILIGILMRSEFIWSLIKKLLKQKNIPEK